MSSPSEGKCPVEMSKGTCGRSTARDNRCIFHLGNKDQAEAQEFAKLFPEELNTLEARGDIDLSHFEFPGEVTEFLGRILSKNIIFSRAVFEKKVYFYGTEFKEADFWHTTFKDEADFREATFTATANFSEAIFEAGADFTLTKFNAFARLRKARFLKPRSVVFDQNQMNNVSFLHTEGLSEVTLRSVQWPTDKGRCRLIDEDLMKEGEQDATYVNIADVYRRLRRNYESRLRYSEAGSFFKSEMEMRRMQVAPGKKLVDKVRRNLLSAIGWYNLLSVYGESPSRVAVCALAVFGVFSFWRFLVTPLPINPCLTQLVSAAMNSIERTILVFFQLKSEDFSDGIERILSALLLTLSAVTLRRQLERHR